MAKKKSSAFLAILKTYAPNYEPKEPEKEPKKKTKKSQVKHEVVTEPSVSQENVAEQHSTRPATKRKVHRERAVSALSREDHELENERPSEEKCLKSYDNWQQVKQELKEEDTERLKQKISLQLQLIHAQDLQYQQKVLEEQEEKHRKRDEHRAWKREVAERFLEQCKKSLAEDRQKAAQKSRRDRLKSTGTSITVGNTTVLGMEETGGKKSRTPVRTNNSSPVKTQPESPDKPRRLGTETLLEDSEDEDRLTPMAPRHYNRNAREATDISSVASLTPQPTPGKISPVMREITTNITREMTRASTLPEEDEDEEEEEEFDEFAEFPWYQQKLYRLYGRHQADYFLHPKIEDQAKKSRKKLDPKFKNPDGHTGANDLWTNLRKESKGKLHKVDATIPEDLKAAFSCFAREGIARLRKPIRRSYAVKEDVPEMDQLLDQSVVEEAQNYRHRMELMFRSSLKNEDRFNVLTFNNPVPNLNNKTGEESVARYMPSWVDNADEVESEMSYKKWVAPNSARSLSQSQQDNESTAAKPELPDIKNHGKDTGSETSTEWDFTKKRNLSAKVKEPKYVFLTERDTRSPGQFRQRTNAMAAKKFPTAYQGSQSAMATVRQEEPSAQVNASTYRSGRSAFAVSTEFSLSGPEEQVSRTETYPQDFPTWEPLSMTALVEYKKKVETIGSGDFARGKAPTWNVRATSVN